MTSRELVMQAVEFRNPLRLPLAKGEGADIAYVNFTPPAGFTASRPGANEWGCVSTSLNPEKGDQGQVSERPLVDWSQWESYQFPNPYAQGRFDHVPAEVTRFRKQGRFICGCLGKGPMHLLEDLRGFENFLTDLLLEPERIERLLDGIFKMLSGLVERFGEAGVDAVFLFDDQAIQTGPLFAMELWHRHLAPRYRRLFDCAHELGMKVYMHTCGNLADHLLPLAGVGVDILDNKQPALWMDSPAVDAVRGRIAFSTCLDIQSTIHTIAEDQVDEATFQLIRRLSTPQGGFIGTFYHQPDLKLPPEKIQRMLLAFQAFRWNQKVTR